MNMTRGQLPSGQRVPSGQRGMVLISSLLLLLVVTILAISMYRSFGIQEKIAGNTREKQRALHAAESAQQYAEGWLAAGNGNQFAVCNTLLDATVTGTAKVCTNQLVNVVPSVTSPPWQIGGADVGVTYVPPGMTVNQTAGLGTYYQMPRFYISYLGLAGSGGSNTYFYRIDAAAYGGNANTVAVVESTFSVSTGIVNLGGL